MFIKIVRKPQWQILKTEELLLGLDYDKMLYLHRTYCEY